jgi:oligosaccharide repeat unit polymerase
MPTLIILFIITTSIFLMVGIRRQKSLIDQFILICFFVVLLAAPFVFIDFADPLLLEDRSQIIFFSILFLNSILVNVLMLFIKPTSVVFGGFISTKLTGPVFDLTSNLFRSDSKFSNSFIVVYMSGWILFQLYTIFNREWIDLDTSRSELWRERVADEALKGDGFGGILLGLLGGLYLVILHEGLISKVNKIRKFAIFVFISTSLLTIFIGITSGLYRSPILFQAFFMAIIYNLYVRRIPMKLYGILAGIFAPIFLSFAAAIRDGMGASAGIGFLQGIWGMATILEAKYLVELKESGNISYEYGYQYLLSMISFVPRFIWPEKPYTNFSFRVSEQIYGIAGEGGAWIHTFTPWGEGYLQFGIVGTLINTCLIFLFIVLIRSYLVRNPRYIIVIIASCLTVFPIMIRGDLSSIVGTLYKFFFLIFFINFINDILSGNRRQEPKA